jgi:hypothetical protein
MLTSTSTGLLRPPRGRHFATSPINDAPTPRAARDAPPSPSLNVVVWLGRGLLVGLLVWLISFSTVEYDRGALSFDFSVWNQGAWLLSHGHFDPYNTVQGLPFWQTSGSFIMWPLAQLTRLPPHSLILLWIEDIAVVAAGWVALDWVATASRQRWPTSRIWPAAAAGLVTILFLANPWVYDSAAYAFHWEVLAGCFVMLTAWDLYCGRTRRVWVWVVLALTTFTGAAVYVIGVGLAGFAVAGKGRRWTPLAVTVAGAAWLALMVAIRADRALNLEGAYGYLAGAGAINPSLASIASGALTHPGRLWSQLWYNRVNFWANLSPSGLIGVITPWGLAAFGFVLVPDALYGGHNVAFAQPSFQNFPAYPLVAVGSVLALCSLGTVRSWIRYLAPAVGIAIAAVAVAWAWAWLPSFSQRWLYLPAADSRALTAARAIIPPNAEVFAADTVSGAFSGRAALEEELAAPAAVQVTRHQVYFVMALGTAFDLSGNEAAITELTGLGIPLVLHQADIWVFRWDPPPGVNSLVLRGPDQGLAAWLFHSTAGEVVTSGPSTTWRVEDQGRPGFVVWGDYWDERPGRHVAAVDLSASGPVSVNVVDARNSKVIGSVVVDGGGNREQVEVPFSIPNSGPFPESAGWVGNRPFVYQANTPQPGATVSVQVVNPRNSVIDVYTVAMRESP